MFPQVVEFGRDGEDDMEVVTVDEAVELFLDPPGDLDEGAQRAGTVFAGVVPDTFNMPFGTPLDVTAECGSAADLDGRGGLPDMERQFAGLNVTLEVVLKHLLYH